MNRRVFLIGSGATALVLTRRTSEAAQGTPMANADRVAGEWVTTSANRIDRLIVEITGFDDTKEAHAQFEARRNAVKEGTLYEEQIKTYGDESFMVFYRYPSWSTYEETCRVSNLLYFVSWDASFIDGHKEGHFLFEDLIRRTDPNADLSSLLPNDKELTYYELTKK